MFVLYILLSNHKKFYMDSKQNQGQQSRVRVDLNDPSEVEYLHSQYPKKIPSTG